MKVGIIGGGVAGLAAAYDLTGAGLDFRCWWCPDGESLPPGRGGPADNRY